MKRTPSGGTDSADTSSMNRDTAYSSAIKKSKTYDSGIKIQLIEPNVAQFVGTPKAGI